MGVRFALPVIFALILVAVLVVVVMVNSTSTEKAYTVGDVQAGMRRDPGAWVGHPLLLQGAIAGWMDTPNSCAGHSPGLASCPPAETLWVQLGTAHSHLTITVPPDARSLLVPEPRLLPNIYRLPVIGPVVRPFLMRLFPTGTGGGITFRVVLELPDCTGAASGIPCSDGVVFTP